MKSAQDRLRAAFNILAKNGIDNVDLYSELAKTEALVNYMDTQSMMQQPPPVVPQPAMPPEQQVPMPPETAQNNPVPTM